jgi:outer membrane protein TolC
MQTIDDCANLRAELAARDAQMKALQEKLAVAEARVAELTPKEPAGE